VSITFVHYLHTKISTVDDISPSINTQSANFRLGLFNRAHGGNHTACTRLAISWYTALLFFRYNYNHVLLFIDIYLVLHRSLISLQQGSGNSAAPRDEANT